MGNCSEIFWFFKVWELNLADGKRLCEIFGRMKGEAGVEGRRERNKFENEDVGMSQLRNPLSLLIALVLRRCVRAPSL